MRLGDGATVTYIGSVIILALVGLFESGRICSALPDWVSALLIPVVPYVGALGLEYLSTRKQTSTPKHKKGGE